MYMNDKYNANAIGKFFINGLFYNLDFSQFFRRISHLALIHSNKIARVENFR